MPCFNIEIAGVPVEVRCRFSENEKFLKDYITDKRPLFVVEPKAEDLQRIQFGFDCMDEKNGISRHLRTDSYLENNAIHALLAENLVAYNVLLMHGSALCIDGQAIVFVAPSGTGKSTHARLWRETFGDRVWMINDDKPMLRIEEKVIVFGTPWDGKHHLSRNASAPLKAVVCLKQDMTNRIEPIGKADAFAVLMEHAFVSKVPSTMVGVMELGKKLLQSVSFYSMGCNTELDAARVAWEGIIAI